MRAPGIFLALLGVLAPLTAAVPYGGGFYFQDFDSLPSGAVTWSDDVTLPGWHAYQSVTAGPPPALRASLATGTSTETNSKGRWFNFGTGTDRALGGSPNTSDTGELSYCLALVNTSGAAFTGFTLSFDWEHWFVADIGETQTLRLAYSTDDTSLNSGTWTDIPAASVAFTTPGGALLWLAAPIVHAREVSASSLNWPAGATLRLRWRDVNDPTGDHGVGIDNVVFSANANPPPPPPAATVQRGPWSGAVTRTSARVTAKLSRAASDARLAVSTDENFSAPRFFLPGPAHAASPLVAFQLDGLAPDALHHYALEVGGQLDLARRGRFRTFPSAPPEFAFAFGSCADTGTNHRVFDHIAQADPLFYLNVGDLHYSDISVNDPGVFRAAFDTVFGSARQAALYRSTSFVYVWDDHDYGPNDSDRLAPGRPAALQVYREYIPHYPLAFPAVDAPIDQSFSLGRARFILSDLRSQRDPRNQADNSSKRMLSATQLAWLKQEFLAAQASRQAIFWVSSVPWIEAPLAGSDMWGGYTTQRREIADFLALNEIANVVILSGDSHMLAADNGTYANFSGDPYAPVIRVLQAAALDRAGSVKGGPYSEGTYPGGGQYGHVTVTDLGETLQVRFSGRVIDSTSGAMTERVSLQFDLSVGPAPAIAVPVLQDLRLEPGDAFSFRFDGTSGRIYRVQYSENLQDWLEVGAPTLVQPDRFEFTDNQTRTSPRRFYRVLVE